MSREFEPGEFDEWQIEYLPPILSIESWFIDGDTAEICLPSNLENVYLDLVRSIDGTPLCTSLSRTHIDHSGEEIDFISTSYGIPRALSEVENLSKGEQLAVEESIEAWLTEWQRLVNGLQSVDWKPLKGRRVDDLVFARLARLYVFLESHQTSRVTELCASIMEVNYETAKSRIRFARVRGLLTNPGKGRRLKTEITQKAIEILGES